MSYPTPEEISFAIDAMRVEAWVWDQQSARLGDLRTRVKQVLAIRSDVAPEFSHLLEAYESARAVFAARCAQGFLETADITQRLHSVAWVYFIEERANIHAQRGLY